MSRRLDVNKLVKAYSQTSGLLIPHLNKFQSSESNYPDRWTLVMENKKEKDDYFHPSSDCLTPVRDLYFEKIGHGVEAPITVSLRRAFDMGRLIHLYWQEILVTMGFVERENVEVSRIQEIKTDIWSCTGKGTVDLLDVEIPNHGKWLIDIKSMSGSTIPDYLFEKYVAQLSVYADWFDRDKLMILGVGKSSPHELHEFIIEPNETLVKEIYDRWSFVSQCIDSGIIPD